MEWIKSKLSARSLFGSNSLFGQATDTLAKGNFSGWGVSFGDGRQNSGGMNEAEILKYGMIGLFVYMIFKK